MKRKIQTVIIICMLLLTFFSVSYLVSNIIILDKRENNSVNVNTNNEVFIKDDMKISLSKSGLVIEEKNLSELKEKYGLNGQVTEESLNEALSKEGYVLTENTTNTIYYSRTAAPNKYYVMNYNDNLAIYISNDKCELKIEDKEKDIYTDSKKFSHLREMDKNKILNYEMEFNTKQEAEAALSELIS